MGIRNPNRRKNLPKLFVNVYQANQSFGGPEEGGWWYTHGRPIASRRAKKSDVAKVRYIPAWFSEHLKQKHGIVPRNKKQLSYLWSQYEGFSPHWTLKNRDRVEKTTRARFAEFHDFRHDIGSVICTGVVEVYVERSKPERFPKVRPRYE